MCTPGSPSVCQFIRTKIVGDQLLNVQWRRPDITGRDDYCYILAYDDGESVGSHIVIDNSEVVSQLITDLKPATEYTITVTVVNGVSDQDRENEFKRVCHLKTTTLEGGMIHYGVHGDPESVPVSLVSRILGTRLHSGHFQ